MRNYITALAQTQVFVSATCDKCGKTETDQMELQEWFFYHFVGGYNSIFGDMDEFEIDLCQQCLKELLGQYLHYKGNTL
jgi:hypothetical protein